MIIFDCMISNFLVVNGAYVAMVGKINLDFILTRLSHFLIALKLIIQGLTWPFE